MRILVEGPAGSLARAPERALAVLADIAEADGADRTEWLAKALQGAGATVRISVPVTRDPRYRVVEDAVHQTVAVYRRALTLAREAVVEVLERAARDVDLDAYRRLSDRSQMAKAGARKASHLMTPAVIKKVVEIIRSHHAAVAAAVFGKDAVAPEDWALAVALGVVPDDPGHKAIAESMHVFGAFLAHLDQSTVSDRYGDTLDEFLDYVKRNPVPQTKAEHHAARYVATRGAQAIVGLGNKAGAALGSALIEADKEQDARLRGIMRDVISAKFGDDDAGKRVRELGIEQGLPDDFFDQQFRSTIKRVASDIGHATGDWTRDIQRIAQTETHTAVQEGMREAWEEQEEQIAAAQQRPPARIKAFKLPRPDGCKHCIELHLDSGVPRIFYLDDLAANGTNVGRKAADWRAVVGATHPWCGCSLHKVPATIEMPVGWQSGDAAPSVIGPGGRLVIP